MRVQHGNLNLCLASCRVQQVAGYLGVDDNGFGYRRVRAPTQALVQFVVRRLQTLVSFALTTSR